MAPVKNILYLGWLGQGNMGDEALCQVFKELFFRGIDPSQSPFVCNVDAFVPFRNYRTELGRYSLVVLGGGSIFHLGYWLEIRERAEALGIPVVSFGTGIDGMFKGPLSAFQAKLDLPADLRAKLFSVAHRMACISTRGPYTTFALIHCGVPAERILEIGDPALQLVGPDDERPARKVLLNWGTARNNLLGGDEAALEQKVAAFVRALLKRGYSLTVYPVWCQEAEAVRAFARHFARGEIEIIEDVPDPATALALISEAAFTINLKLHACILSAACGRPFISLAYRGKCFDFAETVGCADCCIPTDEVTADKLLERTESLEERGNEICRTIASAKQRLLPGVEQVAGICRELVCSSPSNL